MSLAEELKVKKLEFDTLNKEHQKICSKLAKLNGEIKQIKSKMAINSPSVTDHAVLRMLERKYGIDTDKIRDEILCPQVCDAIKVGAKKLKLDGIEYILNDGLVVTIIK